MKDFFRLARPLKQVYERKFALVYYMGISLIDYDEANLFELDWLYGRLVKEKEQERKNAERARQ